MFEWCNSRVTDGAKFPVVILQKEKKNDHDNSCRCGYCIYPDPRIYSHFIGSWKLFCCSINFNFDMSFWQPNPLHLVAGLSCGAAPGCLVAARLRNAPLKGSERIDEIAPIRKNERQERIGEYKYESIMDSTTESKMDQQSLMDQRWINDGSTMDRRLNKWLWWISSVQYSSSY